MMGRKLIYPKGAVIIREGSYQRDAYIIEKGQVEISRQDEKGNKTVITTCGEKEVIGEMTLLKGGTRCATVTALDDCELRVLEYENFKYLPNSHLGVQTLKKIMNSRKNAETLPA